MCGVEQHSNDQHQRPTTMAAVSESPPGTHDELPSLPPISIEQLGTADPAAAAEIGEKADADANADSEKHATATTPHGHARDDDSQPTVPESDANLPPAFGTEDAEHLEGFRLLAALVGIVSVFFIVLLDFSIISTVRSTVLQHFSTAPQEHIKCFRYVYKWLTTPRCS